MIPFTKVLVNLEMWDNMQDFVNFEESICQGI